MCHPSEAPSVTSEPSIQYEFTSGKMTIQVIQINQSSLIQGLISEDTSILIIAGCDFNCTESIQVLGKKSCQLPSLPPGFLDPLPILTADQEILVCGNYAEAPEGSESMDSMVSKMNSV